MLLTTTTSDPGLGLATSLFVSDSLEHLIVVPGGGGGGVSALVWLVVVVRVAEDVMGTSSARVTRPSGPICHLQGQPRREEGCGREEGDGGDRDIQDRGTATTDDGLVRYGADGGGMVVA